MYGSVFVSDFFFFAVIKPVTNTYQTQFIPSDYSGKVKWEKFQCTKMYMQKKKNQRIIAST